MCLTVSVSRCKGKNNIPKTLATVCGHNCSALQVEKTKPSGYILGVSEAKIYIMQDRNDFMKLSLAVILIKTFR